MKRLLLAVIAVAVTFTFVVPAFAAKYISGYTKKDGTYVSGHYRDTSNDGNPYNNANYLGLND